MALRTHSAVWLNLLITGIFLVTPFGNAAQTARAQTPLAEAEQLESQGTASALALALEKYAQALAIYRAANDRQGEATVFNRLGGIYRLLGEPQKAIETFNQALAITRQLGVRQAEARALLNLGVSYQEVGEYGKALDNLNQALTIALALTDRNLEARALNNIGIVYYTTHLWQKALEFYNRSLEVSQLTGDRANQERTLNNVGLIHYEAGEYDKALAAYDRALSYTRASGDQRGEIYTLNNIALVYNARGQTQRALDLYKASLPGFRALGDRQGEFKALAFIACAANALGNFTEARATLATALNIIESVRAGITRPELRQSYMASVRQAYESYIELLMQLHSQHPGEGFDGLALQVSEHSHARSLMEMLSEAYAGIREGIDPALLERERRIQQSLNEQAKRQAQYSDGQHAAELAAVTLEIESLTNQYLESEAQIRDNSPRYAALTRPQPLSLKEIQQQVLDPQTLLLEFSLGEKQSFLWVVSQSSVFSVQLPARDVIETAARNFYEVARTAKQTGQAIAAASRLSQMLLAPVAARLGHHRLLLVGDGALHFVPFAALPSPALLPGRHSDTGTPHTEGTKAGGVAPTAGAASRHNSVSGDPVLAYTPLLIEHEVISLPSASTLAIVRREISGRTRAPKTLAVFADPVFTTDDVRVKQAAAKQAATPPDQQGHGQDTGQPLIRAAKEAGLMSSGASLPRLIGTRREATAILALLKEEDRKQALDFDANRAAATSRELAAYRMIHFATHGLLNSLHPELSGIVLSLTDSQGQAQDGFLRLHEIYNLRLPAELIVLSACQTGLGKEVRGEGLIGLTRGFQYAGAARVVASLWQVDDKATAELMKRFYQGMLGEKAMRPAEALRAAQIAVWQQRVWKSPYYWAAFTLQGEWK